MRIVEGFKHPVQGECNEMSDLTTWVRTLVLNQVCESRWYRQHCLRLGRNSKNIQIQIIPLQGGLEGDWHHTVRPCRRLLSHFSWDVRVGERYRDEFSVNIGFNSNVSSREKSRHYKLGGKLSTTLDSGIGRVEEQSQISSERKKREINCALGGKGVNNWGIAWKSDYRSSLSISQSVEMLVSPSA